MCHKLSQTFGVDEAVLQEDFIDFKIVPGWKRTASRCNRRPCAFLGDESAGPVSSVTRGCVKIPGIFSGARGHTNLDSPRSYQELTSVPVDGQAIG